MLDRVIAEFDAQQEREQDAATWRVQEQRILDDLGLPLWMECKGCIETECQKHSRHLCFEVQPNTDAVVRSDKSGKVLSVEYCPGSHSIACQCGRISRRYLMRVNNERQAVIWDQVRNVFKSPEEIADDLLSLLFC
jgi:hypothetical protein